MGLDPNKVRIEDLDEIDLEELEDKLSDFDIGDYGAELDSDGQEIKPRSVLAGQLGVLEE